METDNAYNLVSDAENPIELEYAKFANNLKTMANEARKASLITGKLKYSPEAALKYAETIDVLKDKIAVAEWNAPLERAALRETNAIVIDKKKKYPDLTEKELGKIRQQTLTQARLKYGASRHPIDITDIEWEAIQAGAISDHMLNRILKYADSDKLKQRAMPRSIDVLSDAKVARIMNMKRAGYTTEEIADRMDISPSTVVRYLKDDMKKGS